MGAKKDTCDRQVALNTLLGTIYEKCELLDCKSNTKYIERFERGNRLSMIQNGRIDLQFMNIKFRLEIKSDPRYDRGRVVGYVENIIIMEEDGQRVKEDADGYYMRQIINPTIDGRHTIYA